MGVDIGAISGYIALESEIEWEEGIEFDYLDDFVESIGLKYNGGYDENYVYLDYPTINKMFSESKVSEIPNLVRDFINSKGIKNPEVFVEDTIVYYW